MKFYLNRQDPGYIDHLVKSLNFENLLNSAIPALQNKHRFKKRIRLDFCGISGSTILIEKKSPIATNAFESVFQNIKYFNENGAYLDVRFIFPYLYSDFSFSLIAAELTPNRATIKDPIYQPRFNDGIEITNEEFYASNCYKNQYSALSHIESIQHNFSLQASDNPNRLQVRFATIPLNLCSFIINNESFSDPYLYSRTSRNSTGLANKYPILSLNVESNEFEYYCVLDDFRYLWNHQQTLYFEDVIDFGKDGRLKIKEPEKIEFTNKSNRIEAIEKELGGKSTPREDILKYSSLLGQNLRRYTRTFHKEKEQDSIFIACSWEKDDTKNKTLPNKHARALQRQLELDFGKIIKPTVVITKLGNDVFETIESELENATLGIIIITNDIAYKDKFYTKPNVYYEFGFLKSLLKNKVVAIVQEGSVPPSNANNIGYYNFSEEIMLEYLNIIIWISEVYKTIPSEMIHLAVVEHEKRLKAFSSVEKYKIQCRALLEDSKDFRKHFVQINGLK